MKTGKELLAIAEKLLAAREAEKAATFVLIRQRGGLPPRLGESPRSELDRVREIRWQMERFAEIIQWEHEIAEDIIEGKALFHFQIMVMRQETGQYDAEGGDLLYEVDRLVQRRLDPTVDVRR